MDVYRRLSLSAILLILTAGQAFARISQTNTNGNSVLGTFSKRPLANFLTNNPLPDGFPWGKATAFDTNYYTSSPDTGPPKSARGEVMLIFGRCYKKVRLDDFKRRPCTRWGQKRNDSSQWSLSWGMCMTEPTANLLLKLPSLSSKRIGAI